MTDELKTRLSGPVLTALLAALTTLAALLTAFGGADVARRNHQGLLVAALVFVLVAFWLGALAGLRDSPGLAGFAMFILVVGLSFAGWAALDHRSGRPLVTASLIATPAARIEATISRDGLGANDQMEADVEAFADTLGSGSPLSTVYRASVGPDETGKIDLSFQVPVPDDQDARSVLIRTWVAGKKRPDLSCSGSGPNGDRDLKHAAACVLIVLPSHCNVPKVVGRTRAAAKRAIVRAGCRVGKTRRAYSKIVKKSHVISEKPPPGTRLPNGAEVDLVVSRGPRPPIPGRTAAVEDD